MTTTKWQVAAEPPADQLKHLRHLPPLIQAVLYRRGVVAEADIAEFIDPEYGRLGDPFAFRQMRQAVDRILSAIEKKERIMIYGDYDADGVTSTAIVYEGLRAFGADIHWYLPEPGLRTLLRKAGFPLPTNRGRIVRRSVVPRARTRLPRSTIGMTLRSALIGWATASGT